MNAQQALQVSIICGNEIKFAKANEIILENILELIDRIIRCTGCLGSFLPEYSNAHMGLMQHGDIICSIPDSQTHSAFSLFYRFHHRSLSIKKVRLAPWVLTRGEQPVPFVRAKFGSI